MILSEKQKENIYNKLKYTDSRICPLCNEVVRSNDNYEVVISKRKTTTLYHNGCIIQEFRRSRK